MRTLALALVLLPSLALAGSKPELSSAEDRPPPPTPVACPQEGWRLSHGWLDDGKLVLTCERNAVLVLAEDGTTRELSGGADMVGVATAAGWRVRRTPEEAIVEDLLTDEEHRRFSVETNSRVAVTSGGRLVVLSPKRKKRDKAAITVYDTSTGAVLEQLELESTATVPFWEAVAAGDGLFVADGQSVWRLGGGTPEKLPGIEGWLTDLHPSGAAGVLTVRFTQNWMDFGRQRERPTVLLFGPWGQPLQTGDWKGTEPESWAAMHPDGRLMLGVDRRVSLVDLGTGTVVDGLYTPGALWLQLDGVALWRRGDQILRDDTTLARLSVHTADGGTCHEPGGCINGPGVADYGPATWEGGFSDRKRSGPGVLAWNGVLHSGTMVEGRFEGPVRSTVAGGMQIDVVWPGGKRPTRPVCIEGDCTEGVGTSVLLTEGWVYTGQHHKGLADGQGTEHSGTDGGSTLEGAWRAGQPHGVLVDQTGERWLFYRGREVGPCGKVPCGDATMGTWTLGEMSITAPLKSGLPQGEGVMTFTSGVRVEGSFDRGLPAGTMRLTGSRLEGMRHATVEVEDGSPVRGEIFFEGGYSWRGVFRGWLPDGTGTLTGPQGTRKMTWAGGAPVAEKAAFTRQKPAPATPTISAPVGSAFWKRQEARTTLAKEGYTEVGYDCRTTQALARPLELRFSASAGNTVKMLGVAEDGGVVEGWSMSVSWADRTLWSASLPGGDMAGSALGVDSDGQYTLTVSPVSRKPVSTCVMVYRR